VPRNLPPNFGANLSKFPGDPDRKFFEFRLDEHVIWPHYTSAGPGPLFPGETFCMCSVPLGNTINTRVGNHIFWERVCLKWSHIAPVMSQTGGGGANAQASATGPFTVMLLWDNAIQGAMPAASLGGSIPGTNYVLDPTSWYPPVVSSIGMNSSGWYLGSSFVTTDGMPIAGACAPYFLNRNYSDRFQVIKSWDYFMRGPTAASNIIGTAAHADFHGEIDFELPYEEYVTKFTASDTTGSVTNCQQGGWILLLLSAIHSTWPNSLAPVFSCIAHLDFHDMHGGQ